MLSTSSSVQHMSGASHRRQNSSPSISFPDRPPLTESARSVRSHRRGNSLDQSLLQARETAAATPLAITNLGPIPQEDNEVSNTNQGHHSEIGLSGHQSQVTQPRPAQPGTELSQPDLRPTTPTQESPLSLPSQDQLKELEQHIKSVYGPYANVYVNVVPSPVQSPQKAPPSNSFNNVDTAPMPASLEDIADICLEPPGCRLERTFSLENSDSEIGYDSSYYSSDAVSLGRSPTCSPEQRAFDRFLEDLGQGGSFSLDQTTGIAESTRYEQDLDALLSPFPGSGSSQSASIADPVIAAAVNDTGISAEEVQAYISEQDPATKRWACLFPGCDKTFGRRENIRSHVQTHLGDRQFQCPHCSKCFVRQHDLKRHLKIHSGNKPYRCPCGNGFARQDALTRHRQRGNCSGGISNPKKQPGQRGRPRKRGPTLDGRVEKANRARRADATREARALEASPSPPPSIDNFGSSQFVDLPELEAQPSQFSDPFSFDTASSPFPQSSPAASNIYADATSPFDTQLPTDGLFEFSGDALAQTPPSSPEAFVSSAAFLQDACTKLSASNRTAIDPFLEDATEFHMPKLQKSSVLSTPPTSPLQAPEPLRFHTNMKSLQTDLPCASRDQDTAMFDSPSEYFSPDAPMFKYDCADWLEDM